MLSREEIKKWLLDNCVDCNGDLNLSDLDFNDFEGDIFINRWKVKHDMWFQKHEVDGDLWQSYQRVNGNLIQSNQVVKGNLCSQKLNKYEVWIEYDDCVSREKKGGN